jgi:ParB family chromosome partitioning protein
VVIRKADDVTVAKLALIENIQREDLNEIEEANAYQQLIMDYSLTQNELSEIIGKSRSYIANLLRLLNLEEEIQRELINSEISNGHARALLSLDERKDRLELLEKIIKYNYSVRKTEKAIKNMKNSKKSKKKEETKKKSPEVIRYENVLADKFNTKVSINHNSNYKGKIEIEYYNLDDLNRIIEQL